MLKSKNNRGNNDSYEIINSRTISASLGVTVPKWTPRLLMKNLFTDIDLDDIFLNEIYVGMGLSSYKDINQFVDVLPKNDVGVIAVKKSMCTHYGTDVAFLD
ncbi:MAG: hypothetical protein K0B07_02905 [DPANN group archaeon]|nr:hypothetical protein [DPANN group archaeon]